MQHSLYRSSVNKGEIRGCFFLIARLMPVRYVAGVVIVGSIFHAVSVVHLAGTGVFIPGNGTDALVLAGSRCMPVFVQGYEHRNRFRELIWR